VLWDGQGLPCTGGVLYTIEDEHHHEILAYHWHPNAPNSRTPWPHVHIQHGVNVGRHELAGTHVPTGRVSLESFLRMIIEVFGVPAKNADWERILERTEGRFDFARNW
jgi:hypothetical protein